MHDSFQLLISCDSPHLTPSKSSGRILTFSMSYNGYMDIRIWVGKNGHNNNEREEETTLHQIWTLS